MTDDRQRLCGIEFALFILGVFLIGVGVGVCAEHYNQFGHIPGVSPDEEPCLGEKGGE